MYFETARGIEKSLKLPGFRSDDIVLVIRGLVENWLPGGLERLGEMKLSAVAGCPECSCLLIDCQV